MKDVETEKKVLYLPKAEERHHIEEEICQVDN